jgi:hypothetical protein
MKFSEYTLTALKNFSTINPSLIIKAGNVQKTINADNTILVESEFEDSFPLEFGIYDLNQFLGNITTLNNPKLDFNDKSVIMSDGDLKLNYYFCSTNLIKAPPNKELKMDQVDAKFVLPNNALQKLMRLAAMNNLPHLSIVGKNGELSAVVHDISNDTSNSVTSKIADYDGAEFVAPFQIENFKIIPDDYDAEIKTKGFMKLTSRTRKTKYFIAEMN